MDLDRRAFVTWSLGGALILALRPPEAVGASEPSLSPWITIAPDGGVSIVSTVSEMGQGARTGQIQILADELDVAWEAITVVMAPDREPYRQNGRLETGGSQSVRTRFHLLRRAGATARAQLTAEAARRWAVPTADCRASLGKVTHPASGRRLAYGELARGAAALPPPTDPPLKDRSAWRYIGKSVKTLRLGDKADGSARYGIDVRLPGMAYATIRQCPAFGGVLTSVDAAPALAVPGVRRVVKLADAVAVVADDTWTAFSGARRLAPKWTVPETRLSSKDLSARLGETLDAPRARTSSAAARDRLRAAFAAAPRKAEATYEVPYLSHSPLEPMNAAARVTADKIEIWAPCQDITSLRDAVGRALDRSPDDVEVTVTLLGGGFGRRLKADYAVQAAQIAQAHGGPVQLVWRREEDMAHDFYRPASRNRYRAVLEPDGLISGYEIVGATTNDTAEGGADPAPYALKGFANTQTEVKTGVPVGAWRSVDASITVFGRESFIDECAHAAGRDPLDYRRALLSRHPRAGRVLEAAAETIGWGHPRPAGQGVGLALFQGWNTLICHAVEVELHQRKLAVRRIVVAGDCGTAVNPDQVKAQWEGGSLMALSAALSEAMTFTDGAADQTNFDTYRLLRMRQAPRVEVLVLESPDSAVGGAGEPPVPGLAAAIANAVFSATGERVRTLPFAAAGFSV
ncbi:MAG: xanthine dehydrogenase family protein molybdopterin-binding subunit [Caulobacteraceae bacterium]